MRLTVLLSCICFTTVLYSQQITIQNPILCGFYPDPSIEKVQDNYYMVNSTFSYMPGLPIFHSKDLKNWTQIGNAIDRDEQLDFMGEGVSRGLFAPTISYHKGTYYIVCTDIDNEGNFVITARNPAGPWSTITRIPEVKGIDPSLYFDTITDKAYIVYNSGAPQDRPLYEGHRSIRLYEFDYKNLKVTGTEKLLVNGGVDISQKPVWIEGPHIYQRGDYYYLCAAEGGTSVHHSQVIFRSLSIDGPYMPWEGNPILTQRHLDANRPNPITSTGHADLVDGPDGNTYAVFLAVRPYEGNHYNIGRETFIAPVKWTSDGWPIINPDAEEVQYTYTFNWAEQQKIKTTFPNGNFTYRYDFPKDTIDASFLFLRKRNVDWYQMVRKGLSISLQPTTLSDFKNPSYLARRLQHHQATIQTELIFHPKQEHEAAGLALFQGEENYYFLAVSTHNKKRQVNLYKSEGSKTTLVAKADIPSKNKIQLKVKANKGLYHFYYSTVKNRWRILSSQDGKHLSTETAGGFVGTTFGPYATSNGTPSQNTAIFTKLIYTGYDDVYEDP